MSTTTITLRINADGTAAITNLDRVGKAASAAGKEAEEGGKRGGRGLKETADAAQEAARKVGSLTDFVKGLAKAWLSFQGARAIANMADTWSDLTSRVQLAIKPHERAADVMGRLSDIARQTYSSLELTGEAYTRNAMTLNALGKSTQQQLDYTQALNNALVVSGAKQDRAIMVQNSLAKAMAEGTLRGEELNNVLNHGGRIAQLLADELGVTVTGLRGVGAEGKITGEIIYSSLVKNMQLLTDEAASMPATIGDAFTLLRNAVLQSVGVFDQQNKISEQLAEALIDVADNMDKVVKVVALAAAGLGAWFALMTPLGRLITVVTSLSAAIMKLVDAYNQLSPAAQEVSDAIDKATESARRNRSEGVKAMALAYEKAQAYRTEAVALLEVARAQMIAERNSASPQELGRFGTSRRNAGMDLERRVMEQQRVVAQIDEQIARLNQSFGSAASEGMAEFMRRLAGLDEIADAAASATSANTDANRANASSMQERARAAEALAQIERDLIDQAFEAAAAGEPPDVQAQLEYEAVVRQVSEQLAEMARQSVIAREGAEALAEAERATEQILSAAAAARDEKIAQYLEEADVIGRLRKEYAEQIKVAGMTRRDQAAHEAATRAVAEAYRVYGARLRDMPDYLKQVADEAKRSAGELFDILERQASIQEILSEFGDEGSESPFARMVQGVADLREEIGRLMDEMEGMPEGIEKAFRAERIGELERAVSRVNYAMTEHMVGAASDVLRSIQTMTKEGSSAYHALELAQQALNLSMAIGGIVNQANGDPYTAWARMAAMAVTMAGYIGQNFGGATGFNDTAAQRQASQGTGTVLGDSEAKSESILRATEITADATTELVGINRGMLRALIQLQDGIAGATVMLARGAGGADFSGMNLSSAGDFRGLFGAGPRWLHDPLNILGGSSRVTDTGLLLRGGLLGDLSLGAYQEVQSRSWRFGSRRTREGVVDAPEDLERQFELVIGSIVDTVREAALALGLLPDEIEQAIASYRQEEIRISLMDLDAEEQEAELRAVFSQIFDGIAGHVVPFIDQFQQVGEGLGETLVRVATSVQVVQESMRYLGLAIDETDPERFAQISVALIDAVGGIDEFITGMQAFANAFAPESFRFESAESALTDAFEQFGLAIPPTRDAMWALMQSLDATTEGGREQIAMLLRLTDAADAYYQGLERQEQATRRAAAAAGEYAALIGEFAGSASEFRTEIAAIRAQESDAVARANELARAAGRQGAAERDLAHIHRWAAAQVAAAIQQLYTRTQELVQQLYGGGTYVHGQGYIQQEIEDFQAGAVGAINEIDNAMRQMYEAQLAAIQRIEDYLIQMQFGGLSALSPTEQLDAARQQLEVLQLAAQAGDADAMAALPQAAQQYLQLLQGAFASGDEFSAGYEWVRELLQDIVDAGPTIDPPGEEGGVWNGYPGLTPETLAERDATLAEQEAQYRAGLAEQLAQHLGDLALAINVPVLELAALMGVSLSDLVADLGINLEEITSQSVLALASMADALGLRLGVLTSELGLELTDLGDGLRELLGNMSVNLDNITGATVESMAGLAGMLGLSLTELTTALGLELTDLAGGLTELTAELGIDLGNLTTESTAALAGLARDLGIDLGELSAAVGVDLGRLTDSQSLLNQTFAAELADLPARERDLLQPLLQAVTDATTEADANAAIGELEGAVNALSPAIRDQLAPYLTGVFPAGALDDLDYLSMIHTGIGDLGWTLSGIGATLEAIRNNLSAANQDAGVPHYAAGGWVNGRTMLVAGEAGRELVLPNHVAEFLASAGIPVVGGGSDQAVVAELRRIGERVERLEGAIGQRIERVEAAVSTADRNNVAVTERASQDNVIRRSGSY
jgi:tape measure domain-containing protein